VVIIYGTYIILSIDAHRSVISCVGISMKLLALDTA